MSGQGFVIHEKNEKKKWDPAVYLVLGIALLALIILFGTGFGGSSMWYGMVIAAVIAGVLPMKREHGIRDKTNYGLLAITILYFTVFWKMSSTGFLKIVNEIIADYNWKTGRENLYYVMPDGVDQKLAYNIFCCFIVLIIGAIYKQILLDHKGRLFFWIQLLCLCICLACKQGQTGMELVCICMAIIGSFMWMNAGGAESRRAILICLIGSFVICGGISVYYLQRGDYKESALAKAMKQQAVDQAEDTMYGKMDSPKGNLQKAASFEGSEDERLQITASEPGLYHLKGYVGGIYEGGVWNPIDQKNYGKEYEGMFRFFGEHGFHPLWQNSQYLVLLDEAQAKDKAATITVENRQASRKYIYVPYGISENSAKSLTRINRDMNVYGDGEETDRVTFEVTRYDLEKAFSMENPDWMNAASADEVVTGFRDAQVEYRSFVHANYLEVNDTFKDYFDKHLDVNGMSGYVTITNYIRDWLKETPQDSGAATKDYLMYFVDRVRQGNSSFYASAGVLMYRYMGIPARYVEGYLVDVTEDSKKKEGYVATATGKNSHAWVEIYKDGIGWIPIEVTPGFYDDLQSIEQKQTVVQNTDVQDEPEEIEEETTYRAVNYDLLLFALIGLYICLVLALLTLVIRRFVICKLREKTLQNKDMEIRMNTLMKYMRQLLNFQGKDEESLSEDVMEILLRYRFCQQQIEQTEYEKLLTYSVSLQKDLYEMLSKGKRMRMKYIACLK